MDGQAVIDQWTGVLPGYQALIFRRLSNRDDGASTTDDQIGRKPP